MLDLSPLFAFLAIMLRGSMALGHGLARRYLAGVVIGCAVVVSGCAIFPEQYDDRGAPIGVTHAIPWGWHTVYSHGTHTVLSDAANIVPVQVTPPRQYVVNPADAGLRQRGIGGSPPPAACDPTKNDNGCSGAQNPTYIDPTTGNAKAFTPYHIHSSANGFFYDSAQNGQITCTIPGNAASCNTPVYEAAMRTANDLEPGVDYHNGPQTPSTLLPVSSWNGTVGQLSHGAFCKYYLYTDSAGPAYNANPASMPFSNGTIAANYIGCTITASNLNFVFTGMQGLDFTNEGGGNGTSFVYIYLKGAGAQTNDNVQIALKNDYAKCLALCASLISSHQGWLQVHSGTDAAFWGTFTSQFDELDGGLDPNINASAQIKNVFGFMADDNRTFANSVNTPAAFISQYDYIHNLGHDVYTSGSAHNNGDQTFQYDDLWDTCLTDVNSCHYETSEQGGYGHTRNVTFDGDVIREPAQAFFNDTTSPSYQIGAGNASGYTKFQFTHVMGIMNASNCSRADPTQPFSPLNPGTACQVGGDAGMFTLYFLAEIGNITVSGNVFDITGFPTNAGLPSCYDMGPGPLSGSSSRGGVPNSTIGIGAGGVMTIYGSDFGANSQGTNISPGSMIHENHGHFTASVNGSNQLVVTAVASGAVNPNMAILHESASGAVGRIIGTQITGPGGCGSPAVGSGSCPAYNAGTYNLSGSGTVASETMDTDTGFVDTQIKPIWDVTSSPPYGGAATGGTWNPWGSLTGTVAGGILTTTTPQALPTGATMQPVDANYGYNAGGSPGTITGTIDSTHFSTSFTSSTATNWRISNPNSLTDPTTPSKGANQPGGGNPNAGTALLANTSEPVIAPESGDHFSGYVAVDSLTIGAPSYWIRGTGLTPTLITWSGIGVPPTAPVQGSNCN